MCIIWDSVGIRTYIRQELDLMESLWEWMRQVDVYLICVWVRARDVRCVYIH